MTTIDEAAYLAQQDAARNAPAPKAGAKPAPKTGPKQPAKKAAPAKPDVTNAGQLVGTALLDLVKEAKTNVAGDVGALANRLADNGKLGHKDLVALRDEIKALAAVLRERKKVALARRFSTANRSVRRLERASR